MLRVGIVGAGFGGQVHLPAWCSLPEVKVVAVADAGSGAAAKLAGDHVAYGNWQELVGRDDIDLVDVVTPPAAQREIVLAALANERHVLCEKPFGATLDDALAMRAAQVSHRISAINYQFRFEPVFQKFRQVLQSGVVGDLLRVDVRWMTGGRADPTRSWGFQHDAAAGGGVANSFLSHVIDYIRWSTRSELVVDAGGRIVITAARPDTFGQQRSVTAEDGLDFLGHLQNWIPVSIAISNCMTAGEGHNVEVQGTQGRLSLWHRPPFRSGDVELVLYRKGFSQAQEIQTIAANDDSRFAAVRDLLSSLRERISGASSNDVPSFDDGVAVHRVLHDWRSIATLRALVRAGLQSGTAS